MDAAAGQNDQESRGLKRKAPDASRESGHRDRDGHNANSGLLFRSLCGFC
jgi:hypothetical protein